MTSITPFLDVVQSISSIKKTETILPIVQQTVYVTPLVVGDDLALRTTLISPTGYDRELIKLLVKHLEIKDHNGPIDINSLCSNISNIDKLSIIWALLKSTYEIFAEGEEVQCSCEHEMKIDIEVSELIHEDTYTLWDKKDKEDNIIPFNQYIYPIQITNDTVIYTFYTKLPTIQDNNNLLALVPTDQIQYNLENIKSLFDQTLNMGLLIKSVKIESVSNVFEPTETSNINEILLSLKQYIPNNVAQQFFKQYEEHFNKYAPKYYKEFKCDKCGKINKHFVNLETSLFRKSLLD